MNPLVHLLFCISHKVEDTIDGLDVKYETVLQVLLVKCQPSIDLDKSESVFIFPVCVPSLTSKTANKGSSLVKDKKINEIKYQYLDRLSIVGQLYPYPLKATVPAHIS